MNNNKINNISNENRKKISKMKRWRHGSMSVVFTAVFVALIIAVNLVISTLALNVNFQVDLTLEQFYSISKETDEALKIGLADNYNDFKVKIKFLAPRDTFQANGSAYVYVSKLAEEYATQYPDNVTVEYNDITKDPSSIKKYSDETQTNLNGGFVIIEGEHHYRILAVPAFFMTSSETGEVIAFQGETKFTAAIIQSSIAEPMFVTFTKGHGETVTENLIGIFTETGFTVEIKDLLYEDLNPKTKIVIVSNPTRDFIGFGGNDAISKNEIDKLVEYMEGDNSLMVFVNSSTPALPNLSDFLWDYWGLGYVPNSKISDGSNSLKEHDTYSIIGNPIREVADHISPAYKLHESFSSIQPSTRLIFRNAAQLKVNKNMQYTDVEVSVQTHNTAESFVGSTSTTGEFPLLAIAYRLRYDNENNNDNAEKFKHVALFASTDFYKDDYLTAGFDNRQLILNATRMMGNDRVVPTIPYKKILDKAMDISTGDANFWTVMVVGIFPLIIITISFAVYMRRRHL